MKGKGVEEGIVDRMEGKDRRKCGWKERKEKEKISSSYSVLSQH